MHDRSGSSDMRSKLLRCNGSQDGVAADQKPKGTSYVHWLAPTTIVVCLISGVSAAIGHHFFYRSLDGKVASSTSYNVLGSDITSQQVNIAVGTAFAFLVKALLVTAVTTAYIQLLWRKMLSSSQGMTLSTLNTKFAGTAQILAILKVWTWWRTPALFAIALLAWLIPIASVIAPATLSIAPGSTTRHSLRHVPNVQWVSFNYLNDMLTFSVDDGTQYLAWAYDGASSIVQAIVNEVATAGDILQLIPPEDNRNASVSWTLDFAGPSLQCADVPQSARSVIEANVKNAMMHSDPGCTLNSYLAWDGADLPFAPISNGSNSSHNTAALYPSGPTSFGGVVHLASFPRITSGYEVNFTPAGGCNLSATAWSDSTIIRCEMVNSTYHASFNFTNGVQTVDVATVPIDGHLPGIGDGLFNSSRVVCNNTSAAACNFDPTIISRLSYQGIMGAFMEVITGSISYDTENDLELEASSRILQTALSRTPELHWLTNVSPRVSLDSVSLKDVLLHSDAIPGLVTEFEQPSLPPLIQTLETMFENITISIMSSDALRPNLTSAYAPPPATVTVSTLHNFYTYSTMRLWIAYGTAIFLTGIASAIGCGVIVSNNASYSGDFSSVFRIAKGTIIDVHDDDADGKDPLPKYLSEERVQLLTKPS